MCVTPIGIRCDRMGSTVKNCMKPNTSLLFLKSQWIVGMSYVKNLAAD